MVMNIMIRAAIPILFCKPFADFWPKCVEIIIYTRIIHQNKITIPQRFIYELKIIEYNLCILYTYVYSVSTRVIVIFCITRMSDKRLPAPLVIGPRVGIYSRTWLTRTSYTQIVDTSNYFKIFIKLPIIVLSFYN